MAFILHYALAFCIKSFVIQLLSSQNMERHLASGFPFAPRSLGYCNGTADAAIRASSEWRWVNNSGAVFYYGVHWALYKINLNAIRLSY